MEEWKTCKIGDVCRSISDTYRGNAEEVVLINTSDVLDGKCLNHLKTPNHDLKGQFKKTFQKDDILYSEIRPANKRFAYIDFDAVDYIASTKLMVIRSNNNILPGYLFYILTNNSILEELQVIAESRSGTFPQITFSEVANIDIYLPPIAKQEEILSILKSLDDKIENNRKINENLEQQAQALFKSWFVDFEPFRDQPFVESELGMIPEGWRVVSLSSIADFINGLAMQNYRPTNGEKGMPVLKIKELGQGGFDANSEYCSPTMVDDKYHIHNGDIVFSWSGTLMVKIWCGEECGLNQHLFNIVPKGFSKWFAYQWTNYHLDNFIRIAKDKAVTMGHIKRGELDKAMVLIPNENDMVKMDYIMNPIYHKIVLGATESHRLSHLRDTLLPKLMSGEIKL